MDGLPAELNGAENIWFEVVDEENFQRINPAEPVLGMGNGSVARVHSGQVTVEARYDRRLASK
jgi:hypothetical protein